MAPQLPKYVQSTTEVEGAYARIKNVYVPMRDGIELCVNIFLPFDAFKGDAKVPVIASMGPYGKDIPSLEFGKPGTDMYAHMASQIKPLGPDAAFELPDPIVWTAEHGYALLRADTRGVGGSQGKLDVFGFGRTEETGRDAEGEDLYDLTEWCGTQNWSNGKVAFSGISYLGMVGVWAAMNAPPHLTCVMSYEATVDVYGSIRRGGVESYNFQAHWWKNTILPHQSGAADGRLNEEELANNRYDFLEYCKREDPASEPWATYRRLRHPSKIHVPIYTAGNWSDAEVHLPGNILTHKYAQSQHKWLEMHNGNHIAAFFDPEHVSRQKQFLDYFMKDKTDNGMLDVPRIRLIQTTFIDGKMEDFYRPLAHWPPTDTEEAAFYLDSKMQLSADAPRDGSGYVEYEGLTGLLAWKSTAFSDPFEIIGSPYLELEVSTEAKDSDLFVYLYAVGADGNDLILRGNHDEPMHTFARGTFRLSHREAVETGFRSNGNIISSAAKKLSPVERGKLYKVTVPLYPTAFLFQPGQSLRLELAGRDNDSTHPAMRHEGGSRTAERLSGTNRLHIGHSRLVLPRVYRTKP